MTIMVLLLLLSCAHNNNLKADNQLKDSDADTEISESTFNPFQEVFSVKSEITGITYPVHVYLPVGYDKSDIKYPVIYWTDGQWYFNGMIGIMKEFQIDAIVVSIEQGENDRRMVDYMHPGTEQYFEFFTKEYLPLIEGKYRVDKNNRTLCGVSAGGCFVSQALITDTNRPLLFKNYFIFDAALYLSYPNREWIYYGNDGNYYTDHFDAMYAKDPELDINLVLTYSYPKGNEKLTKMFYDEIEKIGFKKLKLSMTGFEVSHETIGGPSFKYALKEVF